MMRQVESPPELATFDHREVGNGAARFAVESKQRSVPIPAAFGRDESRDLDERADADGVLGRRGEEPDGRARQTARLTGVGARGGNVARAGERAPERRHADEPQRIGHRERRREDAVRQNQVALAAHLDGESSLDAIGAALRRSRPARVERQRVIERHVDLDEHVAARAVVRGDDPARDTHGVGREAVRARAAILESRERVEREIAGRRGKRERVPDLARRLRRHGVDGARQRKIVGWLRRKTEDIGDLVLLGTARPGHVAEAFAAELAAEPPNDLAGNARAAPRVATASRRIALSAARRIGRRQEVDRDLVHGHVHERGRLVAALCDRDRRTRSDAVVRDERRAVAVGRRRERRFGFGPDDDGRSAHREPREIVEHEHLERAVERIAGEPATKAVVADDVGERVQHVDFGAVFERRADALRARSAGGRLAGELGRALDAFDLAGNEVDVDARLIRENRLVRAHRHDRTPRGRSARRLDGEIVVRKAAAQRGACAPVVSVLNDHVDRA